jgi:hypothetical protein
LGGVLCFDFGAVAFPLDCDAAAMLDSCGGL